MVFDIPLFLTATYDESTGDCIWDWPERWMRPVYDTTWLVLLAIIPLIVMTGLYSRVVYSLWFKRNDGQKLDFGRKVGFTKNTAWNNVEMVECTLTRP